MALSEVDQMRVRRVVAKHLNLDVGAVGLHHRMASDLGADHLDLVEVLMALEDEFELFCLDIPDSPDPSIQDYVELLAAAITVH